MEALAKLITSIASLAWPVIFLILIFSLFDPLKKLIESANGRKFTVKIGDYELTMEEASKQQRAILDDFAKKIAALEQSLPKNSIEFQTAISNTESNRFKHILWVDDSPKNNSFLVATLKERGIEIDIALTTNEGLELAAKNDYDAVISDMNRPEDDHAGIDFTKKLRARDRRMPIYIFCGGWAAKNLREEALKAGVTDITSSESTILGLLQKPKV